MKSLSVKKVFLAFAVLAFAPFIIEGGQTLQWNYCKSKI